MSTSAREADTRAKILFIWSCGLLFASPIWFAIMLVLATAVGIHGDSGNVALDTAGSLITLAPGIASLVLAGLAFRLDHRWWYLLPPIAVALVLALLVFPPYLDGQAEIWSLLVPAVAVVPTAVAASWPRHRPTPAAQPVDRASLRSDEGHPVS